MTRYFLSPQGAVGRHYYPDYKPVVVIDPEDREQVAALVEAYWEDEMGSARRMRNALRSLIEPTPPPKPTEPTGLGAVVEDTDGRKWIRWSLHAESAYTWLCPDIIGTRPWGDVDAVRVLSEGVTL